MYPSSFPESAELGSVVGNLHFPLCTTFIGPENYIMEGGRFGLRCRVTSNAVTASYQTTADGACMPIAEEASVGSFSAFVAFAERPQSNGRLLDEKIILTVIDQGGNLPSCTGWKCERQVFEGQPHLPLIQGGSGHWPDQVPLTPVVLLSLPVLTPYCPPPQEQWGASLPANGRPTRLSAPAQQHRSRCLHRRL